MCVMNFIPLILNSTVFNLYMSVLIIPAEKMEQVAFEKTFVAHYDAVEAFLKKKW